MKASKLMSGSFLRKEGSESKIVHVGAPPAQPGARIVMCHTSGTGVQVRFGVTGHRVLPPRIADFVADRWRDELPTGSELHGVSSLADGADQLFAEHVLAAAGTLHVVLPCEGYAGSLISD